MNRVTNIPFSKLSFVRIENKNMQVVHRKGPSPAPQNQEDL